MAKKKKKALFENVLLGGKWLIVSSLKSVGWIAKKGASGVKQGVEKRKERKKEKYIIF